MADDCQLPNDDAVVDVVVPAMKPLRGGSSFAVSTAQREVHGDPLHRTELPPTLQGFFFCGRDDDFDGGDGNGGNYDGEETEEDDAPLAHDLLPPKKYGRFANLLASSAAPLVDLDPSFSFITKALPDVDHIYLLDSCNGLLLFGHLEDAHNTLETCYIVCNPETEQWVAVPSSGGIDPTGRRRSSMMHTYLLFDPAVSSHFNIVLFWEKSAMMTAHAYSSETGAWSSEGDWPELGPLELWRYRNARGYRLHGRCPGAMVDGMLYLIYDMYWILQVDAHGKTQRKISVPKIRLQPQVLDYFNNSVVFIGQSQGRLHCIMEEGGDDELVQFSLQINGRRHYEVLSWKSNFGISVWVLQDLDTQEWVFKGRVSYLELFGKRNREGNVDYRVAAMHPDCNLLFFVDHWDSKMVSYDIDSKEVRALDIDFHHDDEITPYVPYVSELFLGVIGGHKLAH